MARAGKTITRSISIDAETDRFLQKEAAAHYNGNVSLLISAMTKDARQRAAAGALLRRFDVAPMTDDEAEALIAATTAKRAAPKKKSRRAG